MTAIIDDFSEPESWARELAMRPRGVHPALREHAKEHAQLWQRVFTLEKDNEALAGLVEELRRFAQHDGGCAVRHSWPACDCGLTELLEVTK